jgi:predicted phosphodiesterase
MKIALASDLHLEFGSIELKNTEGADILILSGDTFPISKLKKRHNKNKFLDFIENITDEFHDIIMIAGNHEHYDYDYAKTIPAFKKFLDDYSRVHFLEKETIKFNDTTFICGTLWANMNKGDPNTLYAIRYMMNDFRIIENNGGLFTPADAMEDHYHMVDFIKNTIDRNPNDKYVVVGHHAPSKLSTKPRYQNYTIMNGGFSSDLSELILDYPQIKLWTHGHTHYNFDYMIGDTRIVCNPRGYAKYEPQADNFKLQYIEV